MFVWLFGIVYKLSFLLVKKKKMFEFVLEN